MATEEKYNPSQVQTTPVADSSHKRPENTDPRVDGPYLDDVRTEQENAYRSFRNMNEDDRREFSQVYTSARKGTATLTPEESIARDTRELTNEELTAYNETVSVPVSSDAEPESTKKSRKSSDH